MNFLDKMERKYGRYALKNLPMFIIATYVAGYVLELLTPEMLGYLTLEPYYILHGQVWRLVTWILIPPSSLDIFTIIMLFFYFSIGQTLERTWGSFKFDVYIFSGLIFTVIGAFLLYGMTGYIGIGMLFTTYYINMSIFLAFALTYPDMQVMLYFIIPIKMKWMAGVYGAIILYNMISYIRVGLWVMAVPIVASLLNFVLFFFSTRNMQRYNPKEVHRRREFKKAMAQSRVNPATGGITKHKCAICGRTEKDDPNLEFRFCSKCNGNYEYCQDHLFTHQHVK